MISCRRYEKYFSILVWWIVSGNIFIRVHYTKSSMLWIINTHNWVREDQKYINASKYLYTQYYFIIHCTCWLRFIIFIVPLFWHSIFFHRENSAVFYSSRSVLSYMGYLLGNWSIFFWIKETTNKVSLTMLRICTYATI